MAKISQNQHATLFRASFLSASSLMALQLFSRGFTFILNQAMLRMAPPSAYGTAAIQFEFMLSTILFLSREGVRNALLRVTNNDASMRNISVLPIALGVPLSLATAYSYAHLAGAETKSQAYFGTSIGIYALAGLVELMSEPFHNLAMSQLQTTMRVTAEGLGIAGKSVLTFLVLLYDVQAERQGSLALLAFAIGQLGYGIVVFLTYVAHYRPQDIWPRQPQKEGKKLNYFDPVLFRLAITMSSQSLIKHFLTEGDKLILSWFSPLQDQGGYAVAVNYGSLVARIVFQPIEETSRLFFSRTLGGAAISDLEALQQAATVLLSLLSVQVAFSVILLVFGIPYVPIALRILLPRQYLATSAPKVLSAWVWYIPVLAINGGLEAFLSSVAAPADLNNQSRWMGVFSVIYITTSITLFKFHLGDTSLVFANIINLTARITYCGYFVFSFYRRHKASHLLRWNIVAPCRSLLLVCAISAVVIRLSDNTFRVSSTLCAPNGTFLWSVPIFLHIVVGTLMGVMCVAVWWLSSGRYLKLPNRSKTQ